MRIVNADGVDADGGGGGCRVAEVLTQRVLGL